MIKMNLIDLAEVISTKWHRKSTLIILIISLFILFIWLFCSIELSKLSLIEVCIFIGVLIAVFNIWYFTTKIPKNPKNKVGLGVALSFETSHQRNIILNDLIDSLTRLLDNNKLLYPFNLIAIPQHYCDKVNSNITSDAEAKALLHKTNCRYLIYGKAKLRNIDGKEHHIIIMEAIVSHSRVPDIFTNMLTQEFRELFPRITKISKENDYFEIELRSQWINVVTKYIIGIASYLTGDIFYSKSLYEDLTTNIKNEIAPAVTEIQKRLPTRLEEVYNAIINYHYRLFKSSYDIVHIKETKEYLDKLENIAPNNYNAHLLRSMYYFIIDKNVDTAIQEVRKCKGREDATWRYNYGFLVAYKGKLSQARSIYNNAFSHKCVNKLYIDIEVFINWVLSNEPDKIQFYYILGLINYHCKDDVTVAIQDLERFISSADNKLYEEEIEDANNIILKINKRLIA